MSSLTANSSLLLYGSKIYEVLQYYYAPSATALDTTNVVNTLYAFIGKVTPWDDPYNPPVPTQDQYSLKEVFKNIVTAKKITSADISPVLPRKDWTSGTVYDYYSDTTDMFTVNSDNLVNKNFYVRNRYDQVFKCLWNGGNVPSTDEPFFQPGQYGTDNIYTGVDGYKWKYVYSIDTGSKVKFMDANWMPIPVSESDPNPLLADAGYGNIDVINVINGGSGYDPANAVVTVTVTGDGSTTATGIAQISGGSITDIIVTDTGKNYTYSNVSITSTIGSGATAIAPVSPIGGHSFSDISELGCKHVMITSEFTGSENGVIPTDIDFHQIGLLINPVAESTSPNPANGSIYKVSTDLVVAPGFGTYGIDEIVYQGTTLETSTFSATVLSFDPASNVVRLINTKGSLTTNAPVFGDSSKTVRTLLSYSLPDFQALSGLITFLENRTGIQRSADGIEQFKVVLGY